MVEKPDWGVGMTWDHTVAEIRPILQGRNPAPVATAFCNNKNHVG